jgi:hypothetical protein
MNFSKPLAVAALSLAMLAPAGAVEKGYWNRTWQCGDVEVQLNKFAVHTYELTFSGPMIVWSPNKKPTRPFDFKYVGEDGAMLNGRACTIKEEGPVKEED